VREKGSGGVFLKGSFRPTCYPVCTMSRERNNTRECMRKEKEE